GSRRSKDEEKTGAYEASIVGRERRRNEALELINGGRNARAVAISVRALANAASTPLSDICAKSCWVPNSYATGSSSGRQKYNAAAAFRTGSSSAFALLGNRVRCQLSQHPCGCPFPTVPWATVTPI